jgi:hypothetical protein
MHQAAIASSLMGIALLAGVGAGAPRAQTGAVSVRSDVAEPQLVTTVEIAARKDNTLFESISGGTSNGAGSFLFAGKTATGGIRRAVIAFDVAGSVPAGATITGATLRLNMSRTIVGPFQVSLHRLLADWGEGTSNAGAQEGGGAPATTNDATWIHRFFNTQLWASPGGDFAATPSATTQVDDVGAYTWGPTASMTADVQGWLDNPAGNFGWLIRGDEKPPATAKRFDSRENATVSARPKLIVEYAITPRGSCCFGWLTGSVGCLDDVTEATCAIQPGFPVFNEGQTCGPPPCFGCSLCAVDANCDDGDACTADRCDRDLCGLCSSTPNYDPATDCCDPASGAIQSLSDDDPCTAPGVCNESTGQVTFPPAPSGTACDDGNTCTNNDRCNGAGICVGTSVVCDDGDPCTGGDRCEPGRGCVADPIAGRACTRDSECSPGRCVENSCQCPAGPDAIPTLSQWGLVVLSLLLLALSKAWFGHTPRVAPAALPSRGRSR